MGQVLKSPLRIPVLDHGIAESVDDLVVGTDDSRIAAKSLDQCWLVVDAKLAVEPSLHRFSRSQLPKGFKPLSISHVLEVCSLQGQGAQRQQHLPSAFCGGRVHAAVVGPDVGIVSTQDEKNRGLTGGLKTWPESGLVAQSEMLAVADLRQHPRQCPPPNFPVAAVDAIFPFLAC